VGGLLTSTFLTLVVVPILFTLLIRDRTQPQPDIERELADEPAGEHGVPATTPDQVALTGNGDAGRLIMEHGT
jgi:hypothetical protein